MKTNKVNLGKVCVTIDKDYWDINKDYDKLVIVEVENAYATYMSRQPVPHGTDIENKEYWCLFSKYNKNYLANEGVFNVSKYLKIKDIVSNVVPLTLAEAVVVCPSVAKNAGQIITFINSNKEWQRYQYQGYTVADWNNLLKWKNLNDINSKPTNDESVDVYNISDYIPGGSKYGRQIGSGIYTIYGTTTPVSQYRVIAGYDDSLGEVSFPLQLDETIVIKEIEESVSVYDTYYLFAGNSIDGYSYQNTLYSDEDRIPEYILAAFGDNGAYVLANINRLENKINLKLADKSSIVRLEDYVSTSKEMPNGCFVLEQQPVSQIRLLYDNNAYLLYIQAFAGSVGTVYFTFENFDEHCDSWRYSNQYTEANCPTQILEAFGLTVATSNKKGMMSATDKTNLDGSFKNVNYNSTTKKLIFTKNNNTTVELDATPFIKDGMVDSVSIADGYLVITFNTDSGKETIRIALTDIFNPNNYYTKAQADNLLGNKANTADLSDVATSGSYNDLSDKPTIQELATIKYLYALDNRNSDYPSMIGNYVSLNKTCTFGTISIVSVTPGGVEDSFSDVYAQEYSEAEATIDTTTYTSYRYNNKYYLGINSPFFTADVATYGHDLTLGVIKFVATKDGLFKVHSIGVTPSNCTIKVNGVTTTSLSQNLVAVRVNTGDVVKIIPKATESTYVQIIGFVFEGNCGVSVFVNDAGYLTEHQDISGKANTADLATVATSGNYNDLTNKPTIPTVPDNTAVEDGTDKTVITTGERYELAYATEQFKKEVTQSFTSITSSSSITFAHSGDFRIKGSASLQNSFSVTGKIYLKITSQGTTTEQELTGMSTGSVTNFDKTIYVNQGDVLAFRVQNFDYATLSFNVSLCTLTYYEHISLNGFVQKSNTAGLLKNDGTVDTTQYTTNTGTITQIQMNGSTMGTTGAVDLGTVLTTTTNVVNSGSATPITSGGVYSALQNYEPKLTFTTCSGTTLELVTNTYHRFTNNPTSLAITLPSIQSAGKQCAFCVTTGSTFSGITFSGSYLLQDGLAMEASTTYEVIALYNGATWLITATKFTS